MKEEITDPQTLPGPTTDPKGIRISETFVSRQGEGQRAGNPSFFIRTSGCNLRCWFCDTPYASWDPTGDYQTVDRLVQSAVDADVGDVVLTGGEPLVPALCEPLVAKLRSAGLHVTIETAGTIQRDIRPDLLSLSPKLRASGPSQAQHPRWAERHEKRRMPTSIMRELIVGAIQTQVKFVVSDRSEFDEIDQCVKWLDVRPGQVWIMPEATTVEQLDAAEPWLRPEANRRHYHYADRQHIRWYGNRRGT